MKRYDDPPSPPPPDRRAPPPYDFEQYEGRPSNPAAPRMDDRRRYDRGADRDAHDARPERRPPRDRSPPDGPDVRRGHSIGSRPRPRRHRSYSSESESPPPRRREERRREPRPRDYDRYDSQDERDPPRRRREHDAGYASDSRHNRPRRYPEYDDRDRRNRHRDDRYDDLFKEPRSRRYDDRDRDRRSRHPDDRRYRDSPRRGRDVGKYDWQKEALNMFKEYALPTIKAQGGKYLSKQLSGLASKQR